jgi:hypothetical protein
MAKGKNNNESKAVSPEFAVHYQADQLNIKQTGYTLEQTRPERIMNAGFDRYETWRLLPENRFIIEKAWQEHWGYQLRDAVRAVMDLEAAYKICSGEFSYQYLSYEAKLKDIIKPKYRTDEDWKFKKFVKDFKTSTLNGYSFSEFPEFILQLLERQANENLQLRTKAIEQASKNGMGLMQMMNQFANGGFKLMKS